MEWGAEESKKRWPIIVGVIATVICIGTVIILFPKTTEGPTVSFSFSPAAPKVGSNISFIGDWTGTPSSWVWDFGDGTTSTSKDPTHRYENIGTYSVVLTVNYPNNVVKIYDKVITVKEDIHLEGYVVFYDGGIVPDEEPPVDVWTWSGADYGFESPTLIDANYVTDNIPEGVTCFAVRSGAGSSNYVGWGVMLGVDPGSSHRWVVAKSVDLSSYSKLEFWVKTSVNLKVEIEELPTETPSENPLAQGRRPFPTPRIRDYGWDNTDTWQKITIPMTAFAGVDNTNLRSPFMITAEGENVTFYVDAVAWVP